MFSSLVAAASAAAILFSVTEAAALPSAGGLSARDLTGYTYNGCYTDSTGQRALTGSTYYDDAMTIEKCAAACSNFKTFGVEYGRECFCGDKRNDGSVSAPEAECSFNCPGDATQKCGAGDRLNVYTKATSAVTPIQPKTYTARGCQSEPQGARALSGKAFNDNEMTVEKCAAGCAGYAYFGLEYYYECYCGNFIATGSTQLTSDKCSFPCVGNAAQTCGGDWALNVYAFDQPTTTTSSAGPAPTGPTVQFIADGCYTDSVANRVLTGAQFADDSMTVDKCKAVCSNFDIFGVEYGRECYCGNNLNGSAQKDISECSFPCAGDDTQKCGAGDRLNIYRKTIVQPSSSSTTSSSSLTTSVSLTTTTSEAASASSPAPTTSSSSSETTTSTTSSSPSPSPTTTTSTTTTTSSTTTTTTTTTASPTPTSLTSKLTAQPQNKWIGAPGRNIGWGEQTPFVFPGDGKQPYISYYPDAKWYVYPVGPLTAVMGTTLDDATRNGFVPIYTSIGRDGYLTFSLPGTAFTKWLWCMNGVYVATAAYTSSGCEPLNIQVDSYVVTQ